MEALLRERCEAVVLLGSRFGDDALAALAARVPTLVVARRSAAVGVGVVRGDDEIGIGLAVEHLVELGHRRIAHIDGADAAGSADRRLGFHAAMARHGLGAHAEVLTGGLTERSGAAAMGTLLARAIPPTAVIAFNDRCATGVVDTLVHRGHRVPGDVSVVGYDDSRLAEAPHVQMTTVSQDATALAAAAVDEAVRLAGGGAPTETVLTPRLVVRATTAPA